MPLIAMVADRRGRTSRTRLRIASPVRAGNLRDTANAVKTMVRCASIAYGCGGTLTGRACRRSPTCLGDASWCSMSPIRTCSRANSMYGA